MKWLAILLPWKGWVLGLAMLGMAWSPTAQAQDYLYDILPDGTVSIREYCGPGGDVVIPGILDGRVVSRLGESAFENHNSITSVRIPGSITSVQSLVFRACQFLTSVRFNMGATVIGNHMFADCIRLTSVSIPNTVTRIQPYAFEDCTQLVQVAIPNSVTSIHGSAFEGCRRLAEIRVGGANPVYRSIDGVLFNRRATTLVAFPGGRRGRYVIPNRVATIGHSAFAACSDLTRIDLPDSVRTIEDYAFAGCSRLTGFTIPRNLQSIGSRAFRGCSGLTGVSVPDSVTSIGSQAWVSCSGLTYASLGNGITTIPDGLFEYCRQLQVVAVGRNVTSIGYGAFCDNARLASVLFQGDAPDPDQAVFEDSPRVTVYYVPSTAGWGATYADRPTKPGDPYEPDNRQALAKSAPNGRLQFRSIYRAGDTDWIRFSIGRHGAQKVTFETAGSDGDTQIWLFTSQLHLVASDDDSGVGDFSKIVLPALPPGTYYGRIRENGNNGIIPGYRLRVRWANAL